MTTGEFETGRPHPNPDLFFFFQFSKTGVEWLAGMKKFLNSSHLHLIFVFIFFIIFLYLFFYYIKINIFHKNKNFMNFNNYLLKNIVIIIIIIYIKV